MSDLLSRLRSFAPDGDTMPRARTAMLEAADRIEALAAEVEGLKAERVSHVDYSADLQRIIECICHKRDIRTPVTTARYHFDLAVKYRAEAESAESALAEAISHLNATLPYMLGDGSNGEKAAARDFITAQEKGQAAQGGDDAGQ